MSIDLDLYIGDDSRNIPFKWNTDAVVLTDSSLADDLTAARLSRRGVELCCRLNDGRIETSVKSDYSPDPVKDPGFIL